VDDDDLEAIDVLVESGIRGTRSEAAAWLIHQGILAQKGLLDQVRGTVAEIRRLREEARAKAREMGGEKPQPRAPQEGETGSSSAEPGKEKGT